jgi:hypothetical protein
MNLKNLYRLFSNFLIDPIALFNKWRSLPYFIKNLVTYNRLNRNPNLKVKFNSLYFTADDRFKESGAVFNHYFFQDSWAARQIYNEKITKHIDIGSRLDGFVSNILTFCEVEYLDIRKLAIQLEGLTFREGTIVKLPYETDSIKSLSCLHVLEHIGLGRYGDPIDPEGYIKAAKELIRVLAKGGKLYFATPIGIERLFFDAHRVFSYATIKNIFNELTIIEFSVIPDKANMIIKNAASEECANYRYGCGLFIFTK